MIVQLGSCQTSPKLLLNENWNLDTSFFFRENIFFLIFFICSLQGRKTNVLYTVEPYAYVCDSLSLLTLTDPKLEF